MADLILGKSLANFVRLAEDLDESSSSSQFLERSEHRDAMLRHGVLISEAVTPAIEASLLEVCAQLGVARKNVSAFVFNSAEVQADCLIDSPQTCVLRFTSGLVNLLDEDEFKFVVGHELGHFLLGHRAGCHTIPGGTPESFMVERARELSADRIGFLGVESIDAAIRAIIKTASGLGAKFIRFDVGSFVDQGDLISDPGKGEARDSTHPSLLVRSRALLWFSMAIHTPKDVGPSKLSEIRRVDQRVLEDLKKFVDGHIRMQKTELLAEITLWKCALLIYHSGSFGISVQKRISVELGNEVLESLKAFFSLYTKEELLSEITARLDNVLEKAYKDFPSSAGGMENQGFASAYSIAQD